MKEYRKKLSRDKKIVHIDRGNGRTFCKRAVFDLNLIGGNLCTQCERIYKKEKSK